MDFKNVHIDIALGRDENDNLVSMNLERAPHLLISGDKGSGKTALINNLIKELLYKYNPSELNIAVIDGSGENFGEYQTNKHFIKPVAHTKSEALDLLKWAEEEMNNRYQSIMAYDASCLSECNLNMQNSNKETIPYLIFIIDELSLLSDSKNDEIMKLLLRLAMKSRAAGIHIIIATSNINSSYINGSLRANIPANIALHFDKDVDSRYIIGEDGASSLERGEMLVKIPTLKKEIVKLKFSINKN